MITISVAGKERQFVVSILVILQMRRPKKSTNSPGLTLTYYPAKRFFKGLNLLLLFCAISVFPESLLIIAVNGNNDRLLWVI